MSKLTTSSALQMFPRGTVLAIDPDWLSRFQMDPQGTVEAAISRQKETAVARAAGGVAVVSVRGPIMPGGGILSMLGLVAALEVIGARLRAALADDEVKAVVLDMDSPGGPVEGVTELANEIYSLRGDKPIVAQVNYMACSACYHIAAQADDIVASPSALVGSVGTFIQHMEFSGMLEQDGVTVEYIASAPEKVDGNRFQPLTDTGRAEMQALVDDAFETMVADIARGRGVSPNVVRGDDYGKGHVFNAREALRRGLVDKIRSFAETLAVYGITQGRGKGRARAERELAMLNL